MTPMTARGVPRSLQRDAWWSAAESGDAGATGMGLPIVRRLLAAQVHHHILTGLTVKQTAQCPGRAPETQTRLPAVEVSPRQASRCDDPSRGPRLAA